MQLFWSSAQRYVSHIPSRNQNQFCRDGILHLQVDYALDFLSLIANICDIIPAFVIKFGQV